MTPEQIARILTYASRVYAPAGIEFTFDPASDVARVNNDLLYYDCTLSPTTDLNAPKEAPPACDPKPNNDERNRIAQFYPGKLVVYFSVGIKPQYDANARKWKMDTPRGGSWSNHFDWFVLMDPGNWEQWLAHEIGHYLHLVHSMSLQPRFLNDQITADGKPELGARSLVRDYGVKNGIPKADDVNVFENDKDICAANPTILCVRDAPPDPGSALFQAVPTENSIRPHVGS